MKRYHWRVITCDHGYTILVAHRFFPRPLTHAEACAHLALRPGEWIEAGRI